MMGKVTMDSKEMIKRAMQDERNAARYYRYLAEKTHCREEKDILICIRTDEQRHYCMLRDLYEEETGEKYEINKIRVKRPAEYEEGLRNAVCEELDGIASYERLASALPSIKQKEVICCILNEEREHAQKLAAICKRAKKYCTCDKCRHTHS